MHRVYVDMDKIVVVLGIFISLAILINILNIASTVGEVTKLGYANQLVYYQENTQDIAPYLTTKPPKILLKDDFSDVWLEQLFPNLNGDAYWTFQDGKYAGTYSGSPAIASKGDFNWTNYTYEVDILTPGIDSVVLFRFVDAYNHYDSSFDGNTIYLNRRVNGVYSNLVTANVPYPPAVPFRYKITLNGDNIKVHLNNILYIDHTDTNSPLPNGRIAIGSWSGTREFDNVSVYIL